MAQFEVNLPDSLKRFLDLEPMKAAVARGIMRTALDAVELLAEATPVDTGDTRRRWQVSKVPTADDPSAVVSNDSEVALYLEYGTGIYSDFPGAPRQVIKPKNGKALGPVNWMGANGVYFAWVRGMRPVMMVRRNLGRIRQMLIDNVNAEIRSLLDG